MLIQNVIKNRRLELDLTMKQVADSVGVSEGTVSRWESGDISNMKRDKIFKLSKVLKISPLVILGWDEDIKNLEKAQTQLSIISATDPAQLSGKRLEMLFNVSGYDCLVVCYNLDIDPSYLDNWIAYNELPPKPIIDKILGVFCVKPKDLLSNSELAVYIQESKEWDNNSLIYSHNIIRIAGRDGSYRERHLTDEQLAAFKAMLDALPEAPDDL